MLMDSHLSSGSVNIVNGNGDCVSPCIVRVCMGMVGMFP